MSATLRAGLELKSQTDYLFFVFFFLMFLGVFRCLHWRGLLRDRYGRFRSYCVISILADGECEGATVAER